MLQRQPVIGLSWVATACLSADHSAFQPAPSLKLTAYSALCLVFAMRSWIAAIVMPFVTKERADKRAAIAAGVTLGVLVAIIAVVVVAMMIATSQL
jgi:hypothetical protein